MKKATVGLLPLYIQLYDDVSPAMRPGVEAFYAQIAEALASRGLTVLTSPVCRLEREFRAAIRAFEDGGADALITLHLAYSPSLESAGALAETKLPIIVLDTTPDFRFDPAIDAALISYNHGIHGVQDMCNLLRRNGKPYQIFAGHWRESAVLDRAAEAARVPAMVKRLRGARIGLVGEPFAGMGDFSVPEAQLKADMGITLCRYDMAAGEKRLSQVTQTALDAEYALDAERFDMADAPRAVYDATERAGQAVRAWVREENLSGFSMNFQSAGLHPGFPTMPFAEACKAMAAGVGYAGEGDALTAALVGALLEGYEDATFAEMFCPDWANGSIYFSHMGEFNLKAAARKPKMLVMPFRYAPGFDPACVKGVLKAGHVCLVNLAPAKEGYSLALSEGEMLATPEDIGSFAGEVSGWFRPNRPLPDFLERYSEVGGTHHSALCYGASAKALSALAKQMGFACEII